MTYANKADKPKNTKPLFTGTQIVQLYTGYRKQAPRGFIYKLTGFGSQTDVQNRIEQDIQATLKNVWNEYNKSKAPKEQQEQEPQTEEPTEEPIQQEPQTEEPTAHKQRVRIEEKEEHTLKILLELEEQEPQKNI